MALHTCGWGTHQEAAITSLRKEREAWPKVRLICWRAVINLIRQPSSGILGSSSLGALCPPFSEGEGSLPTPATREVI